MGEFEGTQIGPDGKRHEMEEDGGDQEQKKAPAKSEAPAAKSDEGKGGDADNK